MVHVCTGWKLDVERGPDWLFVRLHGSPDADLEGEPLAEQLWSLLEQHFIHRLVVEMDDVPALRSNLIGQLVLLYKRIHLKGGMLRICGLTEQQRQPDALGELRKELSELVVLQHLTRHVVGAQRLII